MTDSNQGTDRTESDELLYCAHCGAELPEGVWCPVSTDSDTDGKPVVRSFCDDDCKDAWDDGSR